eukprot:g6640.t1
MSSKVVPAVQITSFDTDDASGRQQPNPRSPASGGSRSLTEENRAALSIPGESPLSTMRIEELSRSETEDATAAATMTVLSGLGLGMGFGLESDGAGARTPGSPPARRGGRLEDAPSTSRDVQHPQLGGATDATGGGAAGEGRNGRNAPNDIAAGAASRLARAGNPSSSSGSEVTAWKTNATTKGGGDGSKDLLEGTTGTNLHLKTVANLPGIAPRVREHIASYAEEHAADVSAEINSLSKISAHDEVEEPPRFVFEHESSEKLCWDIFMMILIVFSSFANPIHVGFDAEPKGALWVVEVLVDFIFIADICLNFRTTVMDTVTKETITNVKEISVRYLKGWFLLDLLSSLPVALVSHLVDVTGAVDRYFLALKLLRTLKLHQLSVITNAVLKRFEDRDFNPSVFRIYVFVLAFVLVVHFIACGYWFVSRIADSEFEGLWTPEEEYLDAPLIRQYSRALYFSLVITYGNDLKPENDAEFVFSNLCLTLALLTNAVIIGSATNLLSNMDAGAVAKKTQLDGINGYMRFRKVPKGLQKKIRTFYEYLWDSGQDSHSSGLFEDMPEKLKLQLNIALKKRLIDQVPLFKTFSPAGTIALVQNLAPSIVLPGELIVRQGEPATSMFFISRGTVGVFVVPESDDSCDARMGESYIISLGAGSFFGEVSLLEEENLRTANVRAETFTELQVMHGQDFRALAEFFPEFKTAVEAISKSRKKAGEALGKMKARGKNFAARNTQRSTAEGTPKSLNMLRNAVTAVKAQNEAAKASKEERKPKLRIWAERLMDMRSRGRSNDLARKEVVRSAASMFSSRGATRSRYLDRDTRPQTVYETIVAHEALVSHEAAMRVARGGGIAKDNLMAVNHL